MCRTRSFIIAAAVLSLLTLSSGADTPDKTPLDLTSVMKKKLTAAQKLLGGLALNEFDVIKENAETLNELSQQAAFKAIQTPRYQAYSDEFQRITRKMAQQAKEKNIDGVALAYVEMTLTCVKCHQHVRESKDGPDPPLNLPGMAIGKR